MKNYANPHIQGMETYQAPSDSRLIFDGLRLDFNEKTLPPSPVVQAALQEVITNNIIQVYPEECQELREKIADYVGVQPNQILLTNGSDQAIDVIFRTFTAAKGEVIIPAPNYSMYQQFAELMNTTVIQPTIETVQAAVTLNTQLIIICNPNNPTGAVIDISAIEQLAKTNAQAMIFVDEAYVEFSNITAVGLLAQYPNIVISRTFSKAFGLAGLRIGYVIANAQHITELEKVRNPYDINIFAYYGARAALDNIQELNAYVDEVMNQAKPLVERFFQEAGIEYYPSVANFILFKPRGNNEEVFAALRSLGILTRTRSDAGIDNTIRVTIGTVEQMQKFIEEYKKII